MRRIVAAVIVSLFVVPSAARANDFAASIEKAKDSIADGPNDATTSDQSGAPVPSVPAERRQPTRSLAGASILRSLHVGLGALQAYDFYSTTHALKNGAVEANPLMQETVRSRPAFISLKIAMTAGPVYQAEKLWRNGHRVRAIALMAGANAIMMGVAIHNTRVINNAVK